jgi:hypothetical protein
MTEQQISELLDLYHLSFIKLDAAPIRFPSDRLNPSAAEALNHAFWMVTEIRVFAGKKMEKAVQWLGFVRAMLWAYGSKSVDDFRNENFSPTSG